MENLAHPATVALLRAEPAVAATRINFDFEAVPGQALIPCRIYHTPHAAKNDSAQDPGPPPVAPIAPTEPIPNQPRGPGRPSKVTLATEAANNVYADSYPAMLAAYQAHLAAYQTALDAYKELTGNSAEGKWIKEEDPRPDVIFTHGRSVLERPAIIRFMEGFARTQTILCFEDSLDFPHRINVFRALLAKYPSTNVLAGKSMGARAAARAQLYSHVKKIIFFTYPLVRGLDQRYEELLALEPDTEVLFIIGDSDPLAVEMHLKAIRARMRAKSWWLKVVNGDHAMWFEDPGTDAICNVIGQIAARWNVERDDKLTDLTIGWDGKEKVAKWTEWREEAADPPIPDTKINLSLFGSHLPGGGGEFSFKLTG